MKHTFNAVSPYKQDMIAAIVNYWNGGEDVITQEQLAAAMSAKVTQDFRKRIAELQSEGLVTRFAYRTENNGLKIAYQIHGNLIGDNNV